MRTIGISEFKAKCIAILKRAHRTREAIIVTRRGKPLVRIEPVGSPVVGRKLGRLRDCTVIKTDLLSEQFTDDWNLAKDHAPG